MDLSKLNESQAVEVLQSLPATAVGWLLGGLHPRSVRDRNAEYGPVDGRYDARRVLAAERGRTDPPTLTDEEREELQIAVGLLAPYGELDYLASAAAVWAAAERVRQLRSRHGDAILVEAGRLLLAAAQEGGEQRLKSGAELAKEEAETVERLRAKQARESAVAALRVVVRCAVTGLIRRGSKWVKAPVPDGAFVIERLSPRGERVQAAQAKGHKGPGGRPPKVEEIDDGDE